MFIWRSPGSAPSGALNPSTGQQAGSDPAPNPSAGQPAGVDPASGGKGGSDAGATQFSPEQQAELDRIVAERLKRERERLTAEQQAKAKADSDAAEAKRLKDQEKWQELARQQESKAAELEAELNQWKRDQARRDAAASAGISQLWERLQGDTPEALAEDAKALAAMMQPVAGAGRSATTPTPQAQGGQSDYVKQAIDRQQKRATENDPFAAMMKK